MAHRTVRSGYESLVERINRFPQGAPPSDLLFAILHNHISLDRANADEVDSVNLFTCMKQVFTLRDGALVIEQ